MAEDIIACLVGDPELNLHGGKGDNQPIIIIHYQVNKFFFSLPWFIFNWRIIPGLVSG